MDNLAKDNISKLLFKYSIPAILAMLVTCLYNTVDRAFIGSMDSVGAYAISGLGVTMPVFTIIGAFGIAVSVSSPYSHGDGSLPSALQSSVFHRFSADISSENTHLPPVFHTKPLRSVYMRSIPCSLPPFLSGLSLHHLPLPFSDVLNCCRF